MTLKKKVLISPQFYFCLLFSGHPMHSASAICLLALPLWKMWLENCLYIIPLSGEIREKRVITIFLIPVCLKRQQKREGMQFQIPIFVLADLSALVFFKKLCFCNIWSILVLFQRCSTNPMKNIDHFRIDLAVL